MDLFFQTLLEYSVDVFPALTLGFLISGVLHELVPDRLVAKHLGAPGLRPILYSTLVGTILPVCCWGSLPIAISLGRKGARPGPVLAFLVTTPATSVSALLVTYRLLGMGFALYLFAAVVFLGLTLGLMANWLGFETEAPVATPPACRTESCCGKSTAPAAPSAGRRTRSMLRFAFVTLPKDIGLELVVGLLLAAAVASLVPVGNLIRLYLGGWTGYAFSAVFGLLMYLCSTASVPLVDSLIRQGLNVGGGMVLLVIGPVTSFGTLLVLRKVYGLRFLGLFLAALVVTGVALGVLFQWLQGPLAAAPSTR